MQQDITNDGFQHNSTQEQEAPQTNSHALLPGQMLKAAREACNRHISEIAKKLKLSEQQLDALERDDYAVLGGFIFVRGYLRSYAREVGLSQNEVIAIFDNLELQETNSNPVRVEFNRVHKPNKQGRGFNLLPWVTLIIIVGLMALLIAWWKSVNTATPLSTITHKVSQTIINNAVLPKETFKLKGTNIPKIPEISVATPISKVKPTATTTRSKKQTLRSPFTS